MATFAGSLPPEFLRAQLLRQLRPGAVIKFRARMDDGQVKEKRFVVVSCTEDTVACVINSRIGPFLQNRPALLRCQVELQARSHDFMDHDSHVDCSGARTFPTSQVLDELMEHPDWMLGSVADDVCEAMVAALKFSPTLSPDECQALCESLENRAL